MKVKTLIGLSDVDVIEGKTDKTIVVVVGDEPAAQRGGSLDSLRCRSHAILVSC